jgi:hypothetical protein
MSFRRTRRILAGVLLGITLSFSGCSLYEGPPPQRKKDFGQGSLGCLKDFNAKLVRYFDGKSSAADVNRLAECSKNALRTFGDLVRGENRDRFTAEEVRNFIQRYFLGDVVISDSLLHELMRVKQALVGGKETDFTQEDLKEAEGLINVFRDVLLKLLPSTPLSMDRVSKASLSYVDNETRAIAEVGDILGKRITDKDSTYSFDELGRLFDEIIRAFPGSAVTLGGIRGNLKMAGLLKEVLISPDRPRNTVTAAEWRLVFQDGSRWLGNYLKFKNLQGRYSDWTRGPARARLAAVLDESMGLLDQVVARHCPKGDAINDHGCRVAPGIPFALIQEVIGDLDWDWTIGGVKFEKTTIELLFQPLVRHFFGGTDLTNTGRAASRLTAKHVGRLRTLIHEWIDGARYVEGAYARITRSPDFDADAVVSTADLTNADPTEILRANGGVTAAALAVAEGLRDSFSHTVALGAPGVDGAIFDGKNKTRGRVYRELVRYTWLRPLLKAAVLGYMVGPKVPARGSHVERDGLDIHEFEAMITDYWQLLLDFKMVADGVNTPAGDAKNRFREASLFTQASDGNALISIDEGVQLVLYMLSSEPLGSRVHARAVALCPTKDRDPYGEPMVEPTCYRKKIYDFLDSNKETADLWAPFPLLVQFYKTLNQDERAEFQRYVELAARKPGWKPGDYFTSADSDALPMMFHYIEALFLRFDTGTGRKIGPADGFIDKPEAKVAFPVFRNTLADLSGMKPTNRKVESVFYYLLANGNPPVNDNMSSWRWFWKSAEFIIWWHWRRPPFQADRLSLLQVFATLSNSSPNPTPASHPVPHPASGE